MFFQNVVIDACILDNDSGLLQQVSYIQKRELRFKEFFVVFCYAFYRFVNDVL